MPARYFFNVGQDGAIDGVSGDKDHKGQKKLPDWCKADVNVLHGNVFAEADFEPAARLRAIASDAGSEWPPRTSRKRRAEVAAAGLGAGVARTPVSSVAASAPAGLGSVEDDALAAIIQRTRAEVRDLEASHSARIRSAAAERDATRAAFEAAERRHAAALAAQRSDGVLAGLRARLAHLEAAAAPLPPRAGKA